MIQICIISYNTKLIRKMQMHKTYNVDIQTRSETNNTWKTCKREILPKWLHPGELNTLLVTVNQKVDHQIFLIKYW